MLHVAVPLRPHRLSRNVMLPSAGGGAEGEGEEDGKCCSSASKTNDQELRFKQKAFHGFRPEKINILRRQHESHLKEIK